MVTHELKPTYEDILSWWISLKTDEEAARRTAHRISDCESRGVVSPDMVFVAPLISTAPITTAQPKDYKSLQSDIVKRMDKEETDYTNLWSSILSSTVNPKWHDIFIHRTVTTEMIENYKNAVLSDSIFASRVVKNLFGAEKLGVIHPDMEIISLLTHLSCCATNCRRHERQIIFG